MTFRKKLIDILSERPRSVSSLARELGLRSSDIEDNLEHAIRSARAAGHDVIVLPARCRACGFEFSEQKLVKPGKCPMCRGTRIFEPQIQLKPAPRPNAT